MGFLRFIFVWVLEHIPDDEFPSDEEVQECLGAGCESEQVNFTARKQFLGG